MLHFDKAYITKDGKDLIIKVSIDNSSYFDDVYLSAIAIDTQDSFSVNNPSNKCTYILIDEERANKLNLEGNQLNINFSNVLTTITSNVKTYEIHINSQDLNIDLTKNMFFIYAFADGTPAPNTPCNEDNSKILKTVIYEYNIYKTFLSKINLIQDSCSIPLELINFYLYYKAINYAIKNGDYTMAIKYWNNTFKNNISNLKSCNCGRT